MGLFKKLIPLYFTVLKKGITLDRVHFVGVPVITTVKNSTIEIGKNTVVVSRSAAHPMGLYHRSFIRTLRAGAKIKIGKNVGMSGVSICCMSSIEIEDNVGIGANTTIIDNDFHPMDTTIPKTEWDNHEYIKTKPIRIEHDALIGMNVLIKKGVVIGHHAVIGAGSIIVKDVPPYSVYAAPPAVMIKESCVQKKQTV